MRLLVAYSPVGMECDTQCQQCSSEESLYKLCAEVLINPPGAFNHLLLRIIPVVGAVTLCVECFGTFLLIYLLKSGFLMSGWLIKSFQKPQTVALCTSRVSATLLCPALPCSALLLQTTPRMPLGCRACLFAL